MIYIDMSDWGVMIVSFDPSREKKGLLNHVVVFWYFSIFFSDCIFCKVQLLSMIFVEIIVIFVDVFCHVLYLVL